MFLNLEIKNIYCQMFNLSSETSICQMSVIQVIIICELLFCDARQKIFLPVGETFGSGGFLYARSRKKKKRKKKKSPAGWLAGWTTDGRFLKRSEGENKKNVFLFLAGTLSAVPSFSA